VKRGPGNGAVQRDGDGPERAAANPVQFEERDEHDLTGRGECDDAARAEHSLVAQHGAGRRIDQEIPADRMLGRAGWGQSQAEQSMRDSHRAEQRRRTRGRLVDPLRRRPLLGHVDRKSVGVVDRGQTRARPIPDTGSLAGDLQEAYNWAVDEFTGPEARVALAGLLAELSANPELAQFVRAAIIAPESARVRQHLERAQQRGELRPDADLELAVDVFIGTALARVSLLDHPVDYDYSRALVELVLDGLRVR